MAEVACPSPFNGVSSLHGTPQIELVCPYRPTSVCYTWNPDDIGPSLSLSNGDLTVEMASLGWSTAVRANISKSKGKWYWEEKIGSAGLEYHTMGILTSVPDLSNAIGVDDEGYGYEYANGQKKHSGSGTAYGDSFGPGDIIGTALDLDNGKIWWSKNGVWQASGNPSTGNNAAFTGISGTFFPAQYQSRGTVTVIFEAKDWVYPPPIGFESLNVGISPFIATGSISVSDIVALNVSLTSPLSAQTVLNATPQIEQVSGILSASSSFGGNTQVEISASSFLANATLTCDYCFNYAQIDSYCPTPTCEAMAVFRYARIEASPPIPTASFKIGRIIEGYCPVPGFTCTAYSGRDPSIIASAPCPTCSMRIGLNFSGDVPVPTCNVVADTHHLATIYGRVPVPLITCIGDTENITVISGITPTPTGLFEATVGNVASILGRAPCPYCTMVALTGQVVTLSGRVPVPGSLVRFYASLVNDTIILTGTVPTPTMTSSIDCFTSSILRHVRGKIR